MNNRLKETFKLENLLPDGFCIKESVGGTKLMCNIEAIHAGTTENYHTYLKEEIKKGLRSWVQPYKKPVLTHHNTWSCDPIGRVQKAAIGYSEKAKADCALLTVVINNEEAAQKVLDERYATVSVGCSAEQIICSICGRDLMVEDRCGHRRGEEYDGKVCSWIIKNITFDEISFVNCPADENAHVVGVVSEGFVYDGEKLEKLNEPSVETDKERLAIMESVDKENDVLFGMHQSMHEKYKEKPSEDIEKAHDEIVRQMGIVKLEHKIEDNLDKKLSSEFLPEKEESFDKFLPLLAESRRNYESIKLDVKEKDDKISELNKSVEQLKVDLAKANEELDSLKETNKTLNSENVAAATEIRKILSEQLLEYKGAVDDVERERLLKEYCAKPKDVLLELLGEQKKQLDEMYNAEDPTLPVDDKKAPNEEQQQKKFDLLKMLMVGKNKEVI